MKTAGHRLLRSAVFYVCLWTPYIFHDGPIRPLIGTDAREQGFKPQLLHDPHGSQVVGKVQFTRDYTG